MEKVIQIKNFLPNSVFDLFKSKVNSENFPWFYSSDVTTNDTNIKEKNQGFSHTLFDIDTFQTSQYYKEFLTLFAHVHDVSGISVGNLLRMRLGLILNTRVDNIYNHPHVDYNKPHLTSLYYFDDSDGDTFIFNERIGDPQNSPPTIFQKVRPQENKLIIFDGTRYHSSSNPIDYPKRTVLTINFESI